MCQNYVSQERYKTIYNAEVVAIQFSSDGMWLVTAQMRDDPEFRTDTLLKFWLFNQKLQTLVDSKCNTEFKLQKLKKAWLQVQTNGLYYAESQRFENPVSTVTERRKNGRNRRV